MIFSGGVRFQKYMALDHLNGHSMRVGFVQEFITSLA